MVTERYGSRRNGVRRRSVKRIGDGHCCVENSRMRKGKLEGSDRAVIIVQSKCTPSMKADPYSISQFFDFLTGELLIDESHCECPAGRYRCSHILAETCMIYIAQLKSDWSLEDIVQFLPEAIKSLQALPISISYIYKFSSRTSES